MVIDPYLQQLVVMEQEGSCMVPLVKVPKTEGPTQLSAMQLEKGLEVGVPTFIDTIASLSEDNGAREALPPYMKKGVMPKKLPRQLPLKCQKERRPVLTEPSRNRDNSPLPFSSSTRRDNLWKRPYKNGMKTCGSFKTKSGDFCSSSAPRSSPYQVGESVMTRHLIMKTGERSRVLERLIEGSRMSKRILEEGRRT
ncbi:uncharacterized protein LOC129870257 [Solanum dulcamara]|uniref:uncharacterized protein LOC129870257 n=1 Tax=Solanum dulcamara TaxID=45834 RepID=UPI0024863174|nr:uncharacterized protein LOC129870257 [Solanum dulcamara]